MGRLSIGIAGMVAMAASAGIAQSTPEPGETVLEVASTGEAYGVPDRATIDAGITTVAPTAAEAARANGDKMQMLVAALRAAGIAAADTRTSMVNLSPNQSWTQDYGARITGYTATNSLTVVLRDPSRASAIVAAAFGGGANTVNGPHFALSNDSGAIADARLDAVKRAREQAAAYASAFGMRIVRVVRISERGREADYQPIVVTGSRRIADGAPPPPPPPPVAMPIRTPIELGRVQQSVTLWVDFALAPG